MDEDKYLNQLDVRQQGVMSDMGNIIKFIVLLKMIKGIPNNTPELLVDSEGNAFIDTMFFSIDSEGNATINTSSFAVNSDGNANI